MASALEAVKALASGFATTFMHLFRKPITEEYPEYKRVLPARSRARIIPIRSSLTKRNRPEIIPNITRNAVSKHQRLQQTIRRQPISTMQTRTGTLPTRIQMPD